MHITIYGITTDIENISAFTREDLEEDIRASYYYDYWSTIDADPNDIASDIGTMLMSIPGHAVEIGEDNNGWYFSLDQETIDAFFHNVWENFCKARDKLNTVTEDQIKGYYPPGLWDIKSAISDEYGFMFYSWENGWQTSQDFMRSVEPGTRYYICGAVDAHM